jgi:hypothetical protein
MLINNSNQPKTIYQKMKAILLAILGAVIPAFAAQAENNGIEPKFAIVATAKGQIADGAKSLKDFKLPKGIKISSAPEVSGSDVEIQVLKFDFTGIPAEKYIETLDGKVGAEQVLKMIDAAGYRPATITEVLSVREKLSKIDLNITVYGSNAQLDGKKYYFNIDYHYNLGEDILPYINGKVGLFETDWKGERYALSFAVVKK